MHEVCSQLEVTEMLECKVNYCYCLLTAVLCSKLWSFFLVFPLLILCYSNIDVGVVINDNHRHLRGRGGGVFIKELIVMQAMLAMTAMAPQFAYM